MKNPELEPNRDRPLSALGAYELRARLFGAVELSNRWGRVEENRARQSLSWLLLKYLLVNRGREVSQEELMDSLWPDKPDINADGASRVRLRRLREALQPLHLGKKDGLILFGGGKYCLNPLYDIDTDEGAFNRLVERIAACPADEPEGLALCVRALELMRGPFMEYTEEAPWLEEYRRCYARRLCALAETTLERTEALGDDSALELLCRRTAAIVPEEESVHRAVIRCLVARNRDVELVRYVAQLSRSPGAVWLEN
ncbi:MAG: BTAD domain-containing putative transcriptional regulator [Oscillospiraceae bacterium]